MEAIIKSIGRIKTPYQTLEECPKNISFDGPMCEIIIDKEYTEGMLRLNEIKRIVVLYWLGHNSVVKMQSVPPRLGAKLSGVFAIRSPKRPNPIGMAIVDIERIEGNSIFVKGLDCLNQTALIDLKPAIKKELEEI
jgi:tRNA-Thr(GGU) m(6)t(6)A37 methyltransferase TsaA